MGGETELNSASWSGNYGTTAGGFSARVTGASAPSAAAHQVGTAASAVAADAENENNGRTASLASPLSTGLNERAVLPISVRH